MNIYVKNLLFFSKLKKKKKSPNVFGLLKFQICVCFLKDRNTVGSCVSVEGSLSNGKIAMWMCVAHITQT